MYQEITNALKGLLNDERYLQFSGTGALPYSGEINVNIFRVSQSMLAEFSKTDIGLKFLRRNGNFYTRNDQEPNCLYCMDDVENVYIVAGDALEPLETREYDNAFVPPRRALLDLLKLFCYHNERSKLIYTNIVDNGHPTVFSFLFEPKYAKELQLFLMNGPGLEYLARKVKPLVEGKYVRLNLDVHKELGFILPNDTYILPLQNGEFYVPIGTTILHEYTEKQAGFIDTLIMRRRMYNVKADATLDELPMLCIDNFDALMDKWYMSLKSLHNMSDLNQRRVGQYFYGQDIALEEIVFLDTVKEHVREFSRKLTYRETPLTLEDVHIEAVTHGVVSTDTGTALCITDAVRIVIDKSPASRLDGIVGAIEKIDGEDSNCRFQPLLYGILRTGFFNTLTLVPGINAPALDEKQFRELLQTVVVPPSLELTYLTLAGEIE